MAESKALTIIKPDDESFDSTVGKSGRVDVTTPVLNPLVEAAVADGLTTFQLPDGATFEGEDGKTHSLTVGMVREWASNPAKAGAVIPDGKRVRVGGGKGKNIAVTLVEDKASK